MGILAALNPPTRSALVAIATVLVVCVVAVSMSRERAAELRTAAASPQLEYYRLNDDLDTGRPSLLPHALFSTVTRVSSAFKTCKVLAFQTLNMVDAHLAALLGKALLPRSCRYIFGVLGSDVLANKSTLAWALQRRDLSMWIPETFHLQRPRDRLRLVSDAAQSPGLFILKSNVQRQEGLLITRDPAAHLAVAADAESTTTSPGSYVVAQRLLQRPLLLDGHKINLRVYLAVCVEVTRWTTRPRYYVYDDGFVYYAPKPFKPDTEDVDINVTTGYIDRTIYDDHPLTIKDLAGWLSSTPPPRSFNTTPSSFDTMWMDIKRCLGDVARVHAEVTRPMYKDVAPLLSRLTSPPRCFFSVFGVDMAPADDYRVKLMEINKGPDLGFKDERDGQLKQSMTRELMSLVGLDRSLSAPSVTHFQRVY